MRPISLPSGVRTDVKHVHVSLAARSGVARTFAGTDHVELLVVGREAEPVWVWKLVLGDDDVEPTAWIGAIHRGRQFAFPDGKAGGLADLRIKPPCSVARTSRDVRLSLVKLAAIGRVGKPDAAIGVRNDVIGRIEALAVEQVGDHRRRAVVLVADDAPRQMLAGNLPALEIEGVAVAVVGRHAKDADLTGVFEPAQLAIVRDVAPHEITALGTPGRALGPQRAGPQSLDRPVSLYVIPEEGIDDNYVGVPGVDVRRRVNAKVAGRAGDDARRGALSAWAITLREPAIAALAAMAPT